LCAPILDACEPLIGAGTSRENLAYGEHPRQILDLYLPLVVDRELPPPPLFVWIHGGGWRGGTHDSLPQPVRDLVRRRIAVASIEYRFSDTLFPTTIHDAREAVRWLRDEAGTYGYDGRLIGAGGSSAGGHLAAMLGVAADIEVFDLEPGLAQPRVSVVIDFFGPSALLEMDSDAEENACGEGALCHDCEGSPETLLVDCEATLSTCADAATLASPVTHATSDDPPFVVLHGDEDCTVATPQSLRLHDALVAAGVDSTLYITEGAGHGVGSVGDAGAWAFVHATLERELLGCERSEDEEVVPDELSPCAFSECPIQAAACSLSEDCIDVDACIGECLGNMGCIPSCIAGVSTADVNTHRALFDCADAAGCYGR
jgi:acetyl esterase/lipase